MERDHVVITTNYADGRVIAVYGPLTEAEANNLVLALPASSMRDHMASKLSRPPAFNGADAKGARGINRAEQDANVKKLQRDFPSLKQRRK